jgi:hypothetical protein
VGARLLRDRQVVVRSSKIKTVKNFLKVDSLEITIFDSLNVDQCILTPEEVSAGSLPTFGSGYGRLIRHNL